MDAFRNYSTLLLTLLVSIATVCSEDITITPTEAQYVEEGADIEYTCMLPSPLLSGKGEQMAFLKRQNMVVEEILLGQNSNWFQSAYRDRSIVTPIASEEGHAIGYSVKINNAMPQDSGEFGCVVVVDMVYQFDTVWLQIYVKKQMDSFQMLAVAPNGTEFPLENGKEYQLTKKEDLRLKCLAKGSVPAARVTAELSVEDISMYPMYSTSEAVVVQEGSGAHMKILAYDTALMSNKSLDIKVPQTVTCKAEVAGFYDVKVFTVSAVFKHPPVIQCNRTVAKETQQQVALKCRLASDPAYDNLFWLVSLPTGKNITILDSTKHTQYSSETQALKNGNFTETTLFIDQVFTNHFHNKYYVFAENDRGATQVQAFLENAGTGESTGAASTMAASALLLLTTAILRLL